MKQIIGIVSLLFVIHTSHAQRFYAWPYTDRLFMGTCSLDSPSRVLDSAKLIITYDMQFRCNETSINHSHTVLQCGQNYMKYYNLPLWFENLTRTTVDRYGEQRIDVKRYREAGVVTPFIAFEMIYDRQSQIIKMRYNIPFTSNVVFQYEEAMPKIKWAISDETQQILGYSCIRADALFRGRKWTAWFAPDIPANAGPWKLYGLPGLVLNASDTTATFHFECLSIKQETEAIVLYQWPTKEMTRKAWMKYEQQSYSDPYTQFNQGGLVRFYKQEHDGSMTKLDESWTIPYYPLELE